MPHVLSSRRTSTRPHVSDRGARSTRRGRAHRPRPAAPPGWQLRDAAGASAGLGFRGFRVYERRTGVPTPQPRRESHVSSYRTRPGPRLPPAAALLLLLGAPSTTPTALRRVTAVRSGLVKGVSAPASSGPRGPAGRAHAAARAASKAPDTAPCGTGQR